MTRCQTRWLPTLAILLIGTCWLGTVLLTGGGTVAQAPTMLVFAVPAVLVFRAVRSGVYANRERVRIRALFRTRTVRLIDISSLTSEPRRGDLRSDVLHLVMTDGKTIRTPVRIRNPEEIRRIGGAVYEREEYQRIKHHLGALVHNRKVDEAAAHDSGEE